MTIPFNEVKAKLAPEVREEGERLGEELIARYLTLRELRKARNLSQKMLAEKASMRQAAISKIEKRGDLMLSTIRSYVEAAGGKLEMRVVFPNLPSIVVVIGATGPAKAGRKPALARQKKEQTQEAGSRSKRQGTAPSRRDKVETIPL